ncbi:MAG: helix-turn-helix domain-containing protein [bacterium]
MEYLTTEEAAAILKVNSKTFTRWLEEGRVPGALKLGRQWRVTLADIQGLLKPITLDDLGKALKPAETHTPEARTEVDIMAVSSKLLDIH